MANVVTFTEIIRKTYEVTDVSPEDVIGALTEPMFKKL